PPDGLTAWVARADLAEGIARLMLKGDHAGETLLLTGPQGLDFRAIAELASAIVGRRITRQVVDPQAYLDMLVARGIPKPVARSLVSGFASRAKGELAKVDPTLEEILGRPLLTVAEVLPAMLVAATRA